MELYDSIKLALFFRLPIRHGAARGAVDSAPLRCGEESLLEIGFCSSAVRCLRFVHLPVCSLLRIKRAGSMLETALRSYAALRFAALRCRLSCWRADAAA